MTERLLLKKQVRKNIVTKKDETVNKIADQTRKN